MVIFKQARERLRGTAAAEVAVKPLPDFHVELLTAVSVLGPAAYPAEITRHLNKTPNRRRISLAQVFITLERLQEKGLVTSKDDFPPGARRRLLFRLEGPGHRALNAAHQSSRKGSETNEVIHETDAQPAPA